MGKTKLDFGLQEAFYEPKEGFYEPTQAFYESEARLNGQNEA
jgi:hypothetical protein